jgi:hypothetical protein
MALRFGRTEEWEPSHPGQLSRIAQRSRLGSCSRAPQAGRASPRRAAAAALVSRHTGASSTGGGALSLWTCVTG